MVLPNLIKNNHSRTSKYDCKLLKLDGGTIRHRVNEVLICNSSQF